MKPVMQAIGFFNVYLMGGKLREWGQRGSM